MIHRNKLQFCKELCGGKLHILKVITTAIWEREMDRLRTWERHRTAKQLAYQKPQEMESLEKEQQVQVERKSWFSELNSMEGKQKIRLKVDKKDIGERVTSHRGKPECHPKFIARLLKTHSQGLQFSVWCCWYLHVEHWVKRCGLLVVVLRRD